ncbi:MAG TPA: BrnA antitoxin family protein [Pyrinomonadaceae bacterium]|nr:BrnA antitoxin family protein [Pyrinomonadaceae bacterium]
MKRKTSRVSESAVLNPNKFKRLPRGSFLAQAGETAPRNTKVRISILIDLDVLNFYKERASKPGGLAYQTQINQVLRAHMEGREGLDADTLAQDDRFIRAVAKRVKQLSSKQRKKRLSVEHN